MAIAHLDTLFIADLHLSPARPDKLALFKQLLRGPARQSSALYILGDLFEEFWVGPDDCTPPNPEIIEELAAFSRSGSRLFIQQGNRDLLIDSRFAELTGCVVLPEQAVIQVNGKQVLVMHGDLLCTLDWKYQYYRRLVMNPVIRMLFKKLPCPARLALAHGLRPAMQRSTRRKPAYIVDVEQQTVETVMRQTKVVELIHGHTHRPGIHEFSLDNKLAHRTVLGDWYEDAKILVWNDRGSKLLPVSEYLQQYT